MTTVSTENARASVPAIFVTDIRGEDGQQPGAIEPRSINGVVRGFAFRCPCGCGLESWLPVNREGDTVHWKWDGNIEAPTLTPSILNFYSCQWHGYLTAGEFQPC